MRAWNPCVVAFLFWPACNSDRLAQLERENREIRTQLGNAHKNSSLERQDKCAKQADVYFNRAGFSTSNIGRGLSAEYTSHYSRVLDRCFIKVTKTDTSVVMQTGRSYMSIWVADAYEGRSYAEFQHQIGKAVNKTGERKVIDCKVTLPNEVKECTSLEEFEKLSSRYMDQ